MEQAEHLDAILRDLRGAAPRWVNASLDHRIAVLERVMADTAAAADEWIADACAAKDIPADSQLVWEETVGGPVFVIRAARLLRDTLADIRDHGSPRPPGPITQRADGRTVVGVFPTDAFDRIAYPGVTAEVWMEAGVNPGNLAATMAGKLRAGATVTPEVCLVLGAGNVSSIGPLDVLDQVFHELRPCVLKANPVNDYLIPHWRRALAALIEEDLLAVVGGDAETGRTLMAHPGVDTIHITGSGATHDAIVYGTGDDGARRKAADDPIVTKPITSELGNVTPVIVVPGPWSAAEIEYRAADIAGGLVQNAGFNCNAHRVIITHAQWNQREQLLDAVRAKLAEAPERTPYYPGAEDRWDAFVAAHPDAETFGDDGPGCVPWTLITDVDPANRDDIVFTTEPFNGVFAEVALDVDRDVAAFLAAAVDFANRTLFGTLAAGILVHPSTLADRRLGAAVDQAIADLEYGTVSVNAFPALGFGLMSTTWGAHPGHPRNDIGSGAGVVHNTYLFDAAHKSVVRSPFTAFPPPIWHVGARPAKVTRRLVDFEADPGLLKLPALLAAAVLPGR